MKTLVEKSSSTNDLTRSPAWMKPPPILAKQHLTSFPGGNPFIQPKLKIGQPNDKYEQEADRVAHRVMSMPEPKQSSINGQWSLGKDANGSSFIQRQTDECPECNEEEESIQRQVESEEEEPGKKEEEEEGESIQAKYISNKSPPITPGLQDHIQSIKGSGQPLPKSVRNYFGLRFGRDFSNVRVHTDAKAADAARSINAKAFTIGKHVAFGTGQYSPETHSGRRLLAHELVHVEQQNNHMKQLQFIQRSPTCKNQDKVEKIIKDNPRKYDKTVKMTIHEIVSGDTYSKLAKGIKEKNKVANTNELVTELQSLNKDINASKPGNCVVLIEGWVSSGWVAKSKRVDCTERINSFKADKKLKAYTTWKETKVKKGESSYEAVITRYAKENSGVKLFKGRMPVYATFVKDINDKWIGSLNIGECVALPTNWIDPNIGTMPAQPVSNKALTGDAAKAIAVVYAEQTGTSKNAQEQQKYIWFAIRKRIGTEIRGPTFSDVLSLKEPAKSEFHALKPGKDRDYQTALTDMNKKKPILPGVVNAKRIVLQNWNNTLPGDAGAFYFHWKKKSSSERWYNWAQYAKLKSLEREKLCAWKWATERKWTGNITKKQGWLKRIRGDNKKTPRIGSMYIYP